MWSPAFLFGCKESIHCHEIEHKVREKNDFRKNVCFMRKMRAITIKERSTTSVKKLLVSIDEKGEDH